MSGISIHGASVLLGIDDNAAYAAAARGWLDTRRIRRGGYRYLSYAALRRFAADRRCWLLIPPGDIPDPELRALARAAHAATPGRWWGAGDLAAAYAVHPSRIRVWRRGGWQAGAWEHYGQGYYLWSIAPPPPPTRGPLAPATLERKVRICAAD